MAALRSLSGIRVLDLTRILAGPYASMIMGDLGAEVLKIERPRTGDDTRSWGPPFKGKESAYFLAVNRNKKSLTIDMKNTLGADLIRQLAMKSDVFIENYLPGKLENYGLDYATLQKLNPGLVYCSLTGFGQTGPWAQRAGYDLVVSAVAGLMHVTGPRAGEPYKVGVAVIDLSTGLYAVISVLAALRAKEATGQGCHIDTNLLNTQVATLSSLATNYLTSGQNFERMGNEHPSLVPYQTFRTEDDQWVMIGACNNGQFVNLCEALDLPEVAEDPRFAANPLRVANRKHLLQLLQDRLRQRTLAAWLAHFEAVGVRFSFGPVNSLRDTFALEQVQHNHMVQRLQHATEGEICVPASAMRFATNQSAFGPPAADAAPPVLGAHTTEVLTSLLGLREEEVEKLRHAGVIS